MIEARYRHTCAVHRTREASTFSTACRKFHQEPQWHQAFTRDSMPASGWTGQSRRQPRDMVVPVLIGFLRQYAAASRSGADAQVDVRPAFQRLNDDAHIHSTAGSTVPICLDRHNFATDRFTPGRKRSDMDRRGRYRCKKAEGERRVTACQRVGQTLALFRYLRRGLN